MLFKYARIAELETELSLWLRDTDYEAAKLTLNKNKKLASLCARALLYKSLFQETGIRGWSVEKDIKGKPFLAHDEIAYIPQISLSHSRSLVAIAISFEGAVGIDIEDWQERDIGAIASYAYGPRETNEVILEGLTAFYRIWTVREAIAKMEGNSVLSLMNGKDHACDIAAGQQITNGSNVIYEILNDGHSLALAHNPLTRPLS